MSVPVNQIVYAHSLSWRGISMRRVWTPQCLMHTQAPAWTVWCHVPQQHLLAAAWHDMNRVCVTMLWAWMEFGERWGLAKSKEAVGVTGSARWLRPPPRPGRCPHSGNLGCDIFTPAQCLLARMEWFCSTRLHLHAEFCEGTMGKKYINHYTQGLKFQIKFLWGFKGSWRHPLWQFVH